MLTVGYPNHELFSPCRREKSQPVITCLETKKHLHDVRVQRQNQLTATINECHRLRTIHKEIFNRRFQSDNQDKPPISTSNESVQKFRPPIDPNDSFSTKKYAIPRLDHASEIYRQASPNFELHTPTKLNQELPIIEQLTQWMAEPPNTTTNEVIDNTTPVSFLQQRRLSVSTVASVDKRAHKVYEQWPDYNHISEIVGYRIDPPTSKTAVINSASSRPSVSGSQRKRTTATRLISATKQIKSIMNLTAAPVRRETSKTKIASKTEPTAIAVVSDKPPITIEPIVSQPSHQPKLPTFLCPSSLLFSQRIRTRQWLLETNFARYAPRTLPLI